MSSIFSKEFLSHRLIIAAFAAVVLIAIGSVFYYTTATRVPDIAGLSAKDQTTPAHVSATGTVEPAQNPDLGFLSGGRVARLPVTVGQKVYRGQLLASLDIASLSAQRAQAVAGLAAAQAKLDEMQAGPRDVDVQTKQTAVSQAQAALDNLYANVPTLAAGAYDKSYSGITGSTDTLFNQAHTAFPTLVFSTSNSDLATAAVNDRVKVNADLDAWKTEIDGLTGQQKQAQLDSALVSALSHLQLMRLYCNDLLAALANATPSGTFTAAQVSAAQTAVSSVRDTVNAQIAAIQTQQQSIASDTLAIQAAKDSLNVTTAGSTQQSIEAQQAAVSAAAASVQNIDAQIANAIIRAPFDGTVASVHVKLGDIASPNSPIVTLNPASAQQITAYVSESDASKLTVGESADVTLDAYSSGRHFAATIISVDHAPTMQNGVPAYKVALQFAQSDPAIASGMTANITFFSN